MAHTAQPKTEGKMKTSEKTVRESKIKFTVEAITEQTGLEVQQTL